MNKLVLLLALLVSAAAQAEVYRWVDENGVTIYSQTPPPDGEADTVKTAPAPKPGQTSQSQLDAEMQKLEDYREDKALAAEKQLKADQSGQLSEENCRNARKNLEALTVATRRLIKQPDGSYERLDEKQRQKHLEEARKVTEEYCN